MASRIKANEQGKGRSKIPLSKFLDIAARHRTCIPSTLQAAGRISKNDVNTHRKTARSSTRLHYDVVESGKGKGTSKPEINLEKDIITIAVDSTGIKVTNRGEWIREKWNNKNNNKRRGFIKIHIAVNVRTKKILSMEVTKEDVYDGKMLKKLVDNVVSENNDVKKVLSRWRLRF